MKITDTVCCFRNSKQLRRRVCAFQKLLINLRCLKSPDLRPLSRRLQTTETKIIVLTHLLKAPHKSQNSPHQSKQKQPAQLPQKKIPVPP